MRNMNAPSANKRGFGDKELKLMPGIRIQRSRDLARAKKAALKKRKPHRKKRKTAPKQKKAAPEVPFWKLKAPPMRNCFQAIAPKDNILMSGGAKRLTLRCPTNSMLQSFISTLGRCRIMDPSETRKILHSVSSAYGKSWRLKVQFAAALIDKDKLKRTAQTCAESYALLEQFARAIPGLEEEAPEFQITGSTVTFSRYMNYDQFFEIMKNISHGKFTPDSHGYTIAIELHQLKPDRMKAYIKGKLPLPAPVYDD